MNINLIMLIGWFCGICIGSLINIITCRLQEIIRSSENELPVHKNINFSLSVSCSHCTHALTWRELMPAVISFIQNRRCPACHKKIDWCYPITEIFSGLLGGWLVYHYGLSGTILWPTIFVLILLAAAVTDAKSMLLPDLLTLSLLWLGLLANLDGRFVPLKEAVLGAMFGYLILFVIALAYEWIAKKEGLGGGDMKLLAALGAWLGWQNLMPVLFVAASMALIVGIAMFFITKKSEPAPFGPYLAASGVGFFMYLF